MGFNKTPTRNPRLGLFDAFPMHRSTRVPPKDLLPSSLPSPPLLRRVRVLEPITSPHLRRLALERWRFTCRLRRRRQGAAGTYRAARHALGQHVRSHVEMPERTGPLVKDGYVHLLQDKHGDTPTQPVSSPLGHPQPRSRKLRRKARTTRGSHAPPPKPKRTLTGETLPSSSRV